MPRKRRLSYRGTRKTFGIASLVVLSAGFALLLWLAFDSPVVLTATLILAILIFLVSAVTGRPIR